MFNLGQLTKFTTASTLAVLMAGTANVPNANSTPPGLSGGTPPGLSGGTPPGLQKKACKNNNGIGNNYDVEYEIGGETYSVRIDPGNKGQMNKFKSDLAADGFTTNEIDSAVAQLIDAEINASGSSGVDCPSDSSVDTDYSSFFYHTDFSFKRVADNPTTFHTTNYPDGYGIAAFKQFFLAERVALSVNELNARRLDPTKLQLTQDYDVKVYFINEGAGYRNQFYLDVVGDDSKDGMVFYDASRGSRSEELKEGDYVELGTVAAGSRLDFELRANAYDRRNKVSKDPSKYNTWYLDTIKNIDNLQHVIAFEYEGYLVLAWEDLKNGGDKDYNDIVVAIDIGQTNLANIPDEPPVNNFPLARDDQAGTDYRTPVVIDVLSNDIDPEDQTLTIIKTGGLKAKNGVNYATATIENNQIIYTPPSAFSGVDYFTYTIEDSEGARDTGKVKVTVAPPVTTQVSLELMLSVDVSGSINADEYKMQKDGYIAAFQDQEVIDAIKNLENGMAVAIQTWDSNIKKTSDWYLIENETDAAAFVEVIKNTLNKTSGSGGTDITDAVNYSIDQILSNEYEGDKLVIDVSGDGISKNSSLGGGNTLNGYRAEIDQYIIDNALVKDDGSYVPNWTVKDNLTYSTYKNESNKRCGVGQDVTYDGSQEVEDRFTFLWKVPVEHLVCPPLNKARNRAVQNGITINGLPILPTSVSDGSIRWREAEMKEYYENHVKAGEGAFVEPAYTFEDFSRAIKKKLLWEISDLEPTDLNSTTDSDIDNIPDEIEIQITSDEDGDGIPDYLDTNSDDDAIPNNTSDQDGDGTPDYLDPDSDGDGLPNYLDQDSDGDGIPDSVEATGDPDNPASDENPVDSPLDFIDTDNDGTPDHLDTDSNNNGIPDSVEATGDPENPGGNNNPVPLPVDINPDNGIPDYRENAAD